MIKAHYRVLAGSHMYGLNSETSDKDIRGIRVPTKLQFLDLFNTFEHYTDCNKETGVDLVIYDLRFFFRRIINGDIGTTEMLFASDPEILEKSYPMDMLLSQRKIFLNQKFVDTLLRCAAAHRKELLTEYRPKVACHSLRCLAEAEMVGISRDLSFPSHRQDILKEFKFGQTTLPQFDKMYNEILQSVIKHTVKNKLRPEATPEMVNKIFREMMNI